ncbi:MAG: choice-of-anchor D domain-containing protein, partial [Rhodothermales bacterium]|nr:choice-of-anchor D domain-containing protein [Rhodothermales bacterium]
MPLRYRLLQALVPLLLLAPAASAQTFVEYFEIPGAPTLHGLDYHDGFLWAAVRSSTEPRLLQLDPADGSVVATVPIDGAFSPLGVTWDGTDFWVSRTFSPSASVFRVSPTGEVLGQIPAPSALTNGLAWQGGTLWAAKAYPDDEAALVAVDPADGSVLDTVPFPSTQPGGIAFLDATTVWTTNVGDDSGSDVEVLWKIDLTTGDVLQTLELPTGAGRPRGLAYDGSQYLYAVMDEPGGFDDVVYKIDLGGAGNPVYSATATAVSFTPTVIGTTAERTFTLFNEGDAPLEIFDVQIVQIPEQDDVFATDLADTVIEAGGQRVVTVTFTPTGFGSKFGQYEAFLIFSTNDIATPSVEVPLTGIGAYAEQHVGFVVPFHDFGPVRIEDPYGDDRSVALWPLQLINQGLEPLTVSAITLSDPAFALAGVDLPMTVAPLDTVAVPIAFAPPSVGPYAATATVATDDPTSPEAEVGLQGEGIDPDLSGGDALWTYLVPDNPATSFQDKKVSSVKSLGDVTGDGAPDLVVVTENYYTLALNGNGWGAADTLWSFSTCPDNFNCGSVDGNAGLYETGLVAGADLNGDGFGDAVIATGGGNDHVYALDGTDGSVLWSLGDDGDPYLAAYTSLSLRFDVTGDGVPEIAATTGTASASSPNPYNQRRVYLLDGATGGVVWTAHPGIPNFVSAQIEAGGGPLVVAGGRNEGVEAHVTAYEAGSGVAAWTIGPAVAPFVMVPLPLPGGTEDLVYGGFGSQSGSGGLARVDGATGEEVWSDYTYGSVVWDLAVLGDVDGDDVPDL